MEIASINYDSRRVKPGDLFVAMRGHALDGHDFVDDAVSRGAAAVLSELAPNELTRKLRCNNRQMPVLLQVENSREALSQLSVVFYGHPCGNMNLIGITGTNGKTTTSYILESILKAAGRNPGVIGTINRRVAHLRLKSNVTTPESLDLMEILREMADQSATDVILEVSSHALDQGRVAGCDFRVALFTNISRDHLDYHPSVDAYFEAKSRLFTGSLQRDTTAGAAAAVINTDDAWGKRLVKMASAPVVTYGLKEPCDVTAHDIRVSRNGLRARLITRTNGEINIQSPLIGDFDIYNIMAAASAAMALGLDSEAIASGIEDMEKVPGRMELVKNDRSLAIVVDYAHTPDALEKALHAAKRITKGRILTVFGCGGDRDTGKRFEMGRIAGANSHKIFITSDNPRSEEPGAIAKEIERGVIASGQHNYVVELERNRAIKMAVEAAGSDDLILIAGKGHEDYQIIGKTVRAFDDRLVAARAASRL